MSLMDYMIGKLNADEEEFSVNYDKFSPCNEINRFFRFLQTATMICYMRPQRFSISP